MNILFIHGNYPAQFRHLASGLGRQGIHDVRFLTARKDYENLPIKGVKIESFSDPDQNLDNVDSICRTTIESIQRGTIIQRKLIRLLKLGFRPQLIIFHAGNGLGMFLRELLPDSKLIGYFEWYFAPQSAELILGSTNINSYNFVSARNIPKQHELLQCDSCVVPTAWQASQFPIELRRKLTIIFDGIDKSFFHPASNIQEIHNEIQTITGEHNSIVINPEDKLISYATRGMEPLRGFPEFMRILPTLLKKIPNLKVLIGGRDRSAYGPKAPNKDGSWKTLMLNELGEFDGRDRIVFTGLMNYGEYRKLLYRTNLHFYFTRPYVTSWSLFEAVACGTPVFSNISEATTGTLKIEKEYCINNLSELNNPKIIDNIIRLISHGTKPEKYPYLDPEFDLEICLDKWGELVNNTLKAKKG